MRGDTLLVTESMGVQAPPLKGLYTAFQCEHIAFGPSHPSSELLVAQGSLHKLLQGVVWYRYFQDGTFLAALISDQEWAIVNEQSVL